MRPVVLTIAGSDPSGGAGIQADLKTFHAHGVFGQAAISLLTVQSTRGVRQVRAVEAGFVAEQIAALCEDTPPAAVKTGALPDASTVEAIARALEGCDAPVVVDPVLVSTSGARFGEDDVSAALCAHLLPRCTLVTPNLAEAQRLTGLPVASSEQARRAAEALRARGAASALVTGGHLEGPPVDWLSTAEGTFAIEGRRVATAGGHGTGCALSAAIASRLALGDGLYDAVVGAKRWLTRALATAPQLGAGRGPLNFFACND